MNHLDPVQFMRLTIVLIIMVIMTCSVLAPMISNVIVSYNVDSEIYALLSLIPFIVPAGLMIVYARMIQGRD